MKIIIRKQHAVTVFFAQNHSKVMINIVSLTPLFTTSAILLIKLNINFKIVTTEYRNTLRVFVKYI